MKTQNRIELSGNLERAIDQVDRAVAAGNSDIVLDFKAVPFITVDGLEWLEELLMRASSAGVEIRIENPAPEVYKVFKVAHIDSLLKACSAPASSGPMC